jgi:16S rRNA (guanine966-N2)-methyltransferase
MRITGGTYRSRALQAPSGHATRPTSDRVREALFGILASAGAIEGVCVLDLYAGTGALGLEALSRGATRAVLVESARAAIVALRANVTALNVGGRAVLLAANVDVAIPRIAREGPFGLVLADPPWAIVDTGEVARSLSALVRAGAFATEAWVVVEHASRSVPPEVHGLSRFDSRRYGDATLAFYKTAILPAAPPRDDAGAPSQK